MKPNADGTTRIASGDELIAYCAHLLRQGKLALAEQTVQGLLKRDPRNDQAYCVLASIHYVKKDFAKVREFAERALALNPASLDALNLLGVILIEGNRDLEEAQRIFRRILEHDPNYLNALVNLGNIHHKRLESREARTYYEKALAIDPNQFYALNNLGSILANDGRFTEAIDLFKRAFILRDNDQDLLGNLMNFLMLEKRWEEAYEILPKFLQVREPGLATFTAYNFCKLSCLWEQEKVLLPQVLTLIAKGDVSIHAFENVNLSLLANPNVSNERLFEVHKAAARAIRNLRTRVPYDEFPAAFARRGKIRIGYLSPDFRAHSVNQFFRGVINAHDRDRFEIYLYSSVAPDSRDETTEQYRSMADAFLDANALRDDQLAERIHADGIQILVDLAGYTFRSRFAAMSYRPAPVQLSWIGYPYTSGMEEIDYFISNRHLDGPGNARFFTEAQLHLPESPFTFDSLAVQPIDPVPPYERSGHVTFGTLMNPYKYSPRLISVWSRILQQVPEAKLTINHPSCRFPFIRESILSSFRRQNVTQERIDFVWAKHPTGSHLHYYNDIDVSLDTFPLTGGTTTADAIWMGVPIVTLVGEVYHQRLSYAYLMNCGIDVSDLCAFSENEYIDKAVALARNPLRIKELRQSLPEAIRRSILRDPIKLTRQLETAYMEGWNRKFPVQPLQPIDTLPEDAIAWTTLPGETACATLAGTADQESYIVREHGGWYDAEYDFFLDLIQPGARIIDIGAGLGAYALAAARLTGSQGKVWAATLSPREARLMAASCARSGLGNLSDITEGKRRLIVDDDAERFAISSVDLVRINPTISGPHLLECARNFFSIESPLVMFGSERAESYAKQGNAEPFFRELGYGLYRFMPGLNALVPVASGEKLDLMTINVYACKSDQAARLASLGRLATELPPLAELPSLADEHWRNWLARYPYAGNFEPSGGEPPREHGDLYRLCLTLYAYSQDSLLPPARRHAYLAAAFGTLSSVVKVAPSFPRHMSLIRLMSDLGRVEDAVGALQQIIAMLEAGTPIDLEEPFLALSEHYARLDPGGRLGDWLIASILENFENLRAFSSWFTGEDSLQRLEVLSTTGFQSEAMERRLALLRQRLANPAN